MVYSQLYLKLILVGRRDVVSLRFSSSLVLPSTTNQVPSIFLHLVTSEKVNWSDSGDYDHNEQPQKVQRLGHDPLHSAGREGDQDLQKKLQNIVFIIYRLVLVPRSCGEQQHKGNVWICRRKISSLKNQVVVYTGAGKYHCAGGRYIMIIWSFLATFKVISLNIQTSILLTQSVWVLGA